MPESVTQFGFNAAGLILAGGRGRRLGGRDKGLVKYQGKELVQHAIARFEPQVGSLVLNVNRNHEIYAGLGYRLVSDDSDFPGEMFEGPLAGMQAGLNVCEQAWLACVPCDLPGLPLDLVQRLKHQVGRRHAAAYAHDGKRGHYLCCLLSVSLKPRLQHYLMEGGRAVRDWFEVIGAAAVDFSDSADSFFNVNSEQDLSAQTIRMQDER